jgi:hypothetical protein
MDIAIKIVLYLLYVFFASNAFSEAISNAITGKKYFVLVMCGVLQTTIATFWLVRIYEAIR